MGELIGEYVNVLIDVGGDMLCILLFFFIVGVMVEMGVYVLYGEVVWVGEQDNVVEFEFFIEGYMFFNVCYFVVLFEDWGLCIIFEGCNLFDEEVCLYILFLKDVLLLFGCNFCVVFVMDF